MWWDRRRHPWPMSIRLDPQQDLHVDPLRHPQHHPVLRRTSLAACCLVLFLDSVEISVDMLLRLSPKKVVHMFVDGALRRNDLIIVSWHCVYRVHVALCSCVSENVWR